MSEVEESVVEELRANVPGAWGRLIDRYGRLAYSVPLRMGLSEADAEEVCQATWVILHRHLPWIERPGALSAWILTTAGREAAKLKRARGRHLPLEPWLEHEPPDGALLPGEQLDRLERLQRVRELVEAMPGPCRRLLHKLYFDPSRPSYAEIARALDVPLGSIGPMRGRCLARLARQLQVREGPRPPSVPPAVAPPPAFAKQERV